MNYKIGDKVHFLVDGLEAEGIVRDEFVKLIHFNGQLELEF